MVGNNGSGALEKMKIIGYSDEKFSSKTKEIEVQINPSALKYSKGVNYAGGESVGGTDQDLKFDKHKTTSLNFDFVFDETGILPLPLNSIRATVNRIEEVGYNVDGSVHEPNYLIVSYGSFIFKGRLSSLAYDYTLFRPDGSPLRVKISMSIDGYMDKLTEAKKSNRQSPDMTHRITLVGGETIPYWCQKIYGDSSYCVDIARTNNLDGFRDIKPGTELVFPPLQRNG